MEKEEEIVVETQNSEDETIIIEEIDDENDDNEFLKSLEEIDNQEKGDEPNDDEDEEAKAEALRIKNKNAEEARKRRESEAKAKAEAKAKEEEANKAKEKTQVEDEEVEEITPQQQVKDLITKYPTIDLGELDNNENFQEYLQGKWVKGGKSITEIYEAYLSYEARITKQDKAEVEKQYQKKSTPSLRGSSGGTGGTTKVEDVYTKEELESLSAKMPYMNPKQYASIEEKYERSIKYHRKNNK